MSYNRYRKRHYNLSKSKARDYAQSMQTLEDEFDSLDDWILSSMKDSCYKHYDNYIVRLSNHSADNKYHDLHDGKLIVNIKCSKLDFIKVINNDLPKILDDVNKLDLTSIRFISIAVKRKAYLKGYKTKHIEF